jgi:YVTN family beta-propeller protein
MPRLPRGTVTFLFSDIEGSTVLLRQLGQDQYGQALADYQRLVREVCGAAGGTEVDTQGDAFLFVFPRARDAVQGAVAVQRALAGHAWPDGTTLRARIGLHTGEASVAGDRYVGLSVHRAARVGAAAAGGQVLLSQATASMVEDEDLGDLRLRDLGRHTLKDFERPVGLYQLEAPDLPGRFRAPAARRGRRRPTTPWLIAGVAVIVVALGVPLTLLTRGGGTSGTELGPGDVAVIDPSTNRVIDAIPVGFASPLIAAGEGYVWVVDSRGSTVTKIDPKTRNVRTFAIESGAIPTGIAVGNGSVWIGIVDGRELALLELGPELGDPRNRFVLERGRTPFSIVRESVLPAVAGGAVFTLETARGEVTRIESGKRTVLTEGLDADAISVRGGIVWLAGKTGVTKLSAHTGKTLKAIPVNLVESTTISIQASADFVWFAGSAQPRVFRSPPNGIYTTFSVGESPNGITVGGGTAWVASGDSTVTRVNKDESVQPIRLAVAPAGIVTAYGAVWTSPAS